MSARRVGRYLMFDAFASGGMASIHFGRLTGDSGFARLVVLKRLHPQFAKDAEFVGMFTDEARVSARVSHPNVVSVHDVVKDGEELVLVMDYVHGEPLSKLIRAAIDRAGAVPPRIAAGVVAQALHGLHAAHDARGDGGKPLQIVHRDVSPQNILVGADGIARVVDFGVAKALGKSQHTSEGNMKGKIRYFAPEQLSNDVDRRTDVFAAGVVLWEALLGERLFTGETQWEIIQSVLSREIRSPDEVNARVPTELASAVMKALCRDREARWPTARAMAVALEHAGVASTGEIAEWIELLAGEDLEARRSDIAALEGLEEVAPPPSVRSIGATRQAARARTSETPTPEERSRASVEAETPPPSRDPSNRGRRASSRLGWIAGAGVVVGIAGLAFGLGSMLRGNGPTTSSSTSAPANLDATSAEAPSSSARPAPSTEFVAVPTASTTAPPTPSSSDSAPIGPDKKKDVRATADVLPRPPVPTPARPAAKACTQGGDECQRTEECVDGSCFCAGTYCDGVCIDTTRDRRHCGSCDHACGGEEACTRGDCVGCPGPFLAVCNNTCVNLNAWETCGGCKPCGMLERCDDFHCVPR